MVRVTNTTTTRRTPSPGRTIFRKRSDGKPSTIRRTAVLSAKSASGWITGRSCEGNVSANEKFRELPCTDHSRHGLCGDAGVHVCGCCRDRRGGAGRTGDEADVFRADQRAAIFWIRGQGSGGEGR